MTLGRITQRWSEIRRMDAKKKAGPGKKWRTKVIKIILGWLHDKWIMRCDIYQDPERDLEQEALYEECVQWWRARETRELMRGDAHLRNPRQQPRREHSKDCLREWIRTRRIAEEVHQRCRPDKTQPTLHRWLVRSIKNP